MMMMMVTLKEMMMILGQEGGKRRSKWSQLNSNELGQNCKRGKFLKKFWCYAVFFLGEEGVLYNKLVIM